MRALIALALALTAAACDIEKSPSPSPAPLPARTSRIPIVARPVAQRATAPAPKPIAKADPWDTTVAADPDLEQDTEDARTALRLDRMSQIRTELDANHDGRVTAAELSANERYASRFTDASTIDLDNDGDFSVDELLQSKDDRRASRIW